MKKKKMQRGAGLALTLALFGATAAQAAPYFYWNGSVSTNWHDAGNWTIDRRGDTTTNLVPWVTDVAYINAAPGNLPTLSTTETALVFRVAYDTSTVGELNVVDGANLSVDYDRNLNDRIGNSGGVGTVNQSGGLLGLNYLTLGNGAGSEGTYNLSGGTLRMVNSGGGSSLFLANAGTGTFNLTGGTLETLRGVTISGSTEGAGTFNVFGDGVGHVGGVDDAAGGFWDQGEFGTLSATVDSDNGFSLGQINILGGSNETPYVTFQYGATLQLGFSGDDMGDVTNSWDLITFPTNTVVTDNGLALINTDTNNWSFAFTNNALRVTYGIGDTSIAPTNPPPSGPRTLYWTGNGSDMNATNAANWNQDLAGTAATWGVYEDDSIYVGHATVNDSGFVSECTFDGLPNAGQMRLYIGQGRTGIVNFNSGDLILPKPSGSARSSYVGWNSPDGDGTLNVNGGNIDLYATELGESGASGSINLNGGSLLLSGRIASAGLGTDGRASLWIGGVNGGSGTVHVSGGELKTLIGAALGNASGVGTFHVNGSGASLIDLGSTRSDFDGFWHQNEGSTLKITVDEGGVTPINISEGGNDNGAERVGLADVVFESGTILDIGWMTGVTNYGSFDVMTFGGTYEDNGLALAPGVDTDLWSFAFVDTDSNGTNDTLRVTANAGTTSNGTPINWLLDYGLTEADDDVDNDGDGLLSWEEYVAGTVPTNGSSVLEINAYAVDGGSYTLDWKSVEGKSYSIMTSSDLVNGTPTVEASGITGLPTETSYTGTVSGAGAVFYSIGVE
ncbi:hypothetical protein P4C99_00625 [Pontiellaceae bacterium B1224]|nr:hypothetical protein [Pontiellaceae bacterium B1224]